MKIRKDALVMARIRVSNGNDEARRYEIGAEAEFSAGRLVRIAGGTVYSAEGGNLAGFSSEAHRPLCVEFVTADRDTRSDVFAAVQDFAASLSEEGIDMTADIV